MNEKREVALSRSGSCQTIDKPDEEIKELEQHAKDLALYSRADSTAQAYQGDFDRFVDWANNHDLDFLPASPETVALYLASLEQDDKAPATIKRILSSLSQGHKAFGLASPTANATVKDVVKGILRTKGAAQRQAKPLLARQLQQIIDIIPPDVVGIRDRALLLIGWAGALRRSELCALKVEDIERVEQGIVLTIRRSKGDPLGHGQKVAIPTINSKYCPRAALSKWLSMAQIKTGFLFCGVGFGGKNKFFSRVDNSRPLDARMVALVVKKWIKQIGLDPTQYSAHSLRAGWTTSAAAINAPNHVMLQHTRHKSVKTLLGYVRDGQLFNDSPLPLLLGV